MQPSEKHKNIFLQRESDSIKLFVAFYFSGHVNFEKIIEGSIAKADAFIPEKGVLIEVKELHDLEANQKSAQWSKLVHKLKGYIKKDSRFIKLKGLYDVNTPQLFKIAPKKLEESANKIVEAIEKNQPSVNIANEEFEIRRYEADTSEIVFSTHYGGAVNPSGIIFQNIIQRLQTADRQLGINPENGTVQKRILLLVNQYQYAERMYEVIEGLGYAYETFKALKNIDEIWFQFKEKEETKHTLIYERNFIIQYENKCLEPTEINNELFCLWFQGLERLSDVHKDKLFNGLKCLIAKKTPDEIFSNKYSRGSMVRLADWLCEKKRFEDAIWLIEQFINDEDPPISSRYEGDPQFNYDLEIRKGNDPRIITTVLGHLAWGIQSVSTSQEHILKAYALTKKLLKHENLYVILEVLIPLSAISARRMWIKDLDKKNKTNIYADFRESVFFVLRNYGKYPAIAKRLTHVFSYFKDLTTDEALEVLNILKIEDDSAPLFIYFGIYRQRHYKKDGIDITNFNPEPLQKNLVDALKTEDENSQKLIESMSWHFWKILNEEPQEFETVKSYIDIIVNGSYKRRAFENIERIIIDWLKKEPEVCTKWYVIILNKTVSFVKNNPEKARTVWLNSDQIISFIAKRFPDNLIEIIDSLAYLWEQGMFIGGLETIFNSYKEVTNSELRHKVKQKLELVYKEFKKLNPKLISVIFN